jgi:hypothetical protein
MKKFFLILLTTVFVASCSLDESGNGDENESLYQSYGVVKEYTNATGKLYVHSDEGKVIIPSLSNLLSIEHRDSRVWMLFSTVDDPQLDTIKANVYDFLQITQMEFKLKNDESTVNDVYLTNMWVAQDYLTLIMDVTASSENSLKNHKYTMCLDKDFVNNTEQVSDTVWMEFKYDRNNDAPGTKFTKIVALKLDDKVNARVLVVKYKTATGFKEKFVTYKK